MEERFCVVCGKKLDGKKMKFCSLSCKQKDFYRNRGGKSNTSFRQFIRAASRKMELIDLKGGKCEMCGYDKNISALEFHHIDPSTKKHNLDSRFLANSSYEKIAEEVDKCMLLCSNCHKEIHNENFDRAVLEKVLNENSDTIRKDREIKYCKDCGKQLLSENKSGYCLSCLGKRRRKVERPGKDELERLIQEHSLNQIGKKYGVSHNAVKKWLISYKIWK